MIRYEYHEPYWSEKKWWVKYHSKPFYLWYKRCEEQGLQGFKKYIEYSRETVKYYLRGLFDSDGGNYRNKYIYLSNSNKKLLGYVQCLLKECFSIIATGPYLQKKSGSKIIINRVETL